jgi:hypothetical protein
MRTRKGARGSHADSARHRQMGPTERTAVKTGVSPLTSESSVVSQPHSRLPEQAVGATASTLVYQEDGAPPTVAQTRFGWNHQVTGVTHRADCEPPPRLGGARRRRATRPLLTAVLERALIGPPGVAAAGANERTTAARLRSMATALACCSRAVIQEWLRQFALMQSICVYTRSNSADCVRYLNVLGYGACTHVVLLRRVGRQSLAARSGRARFPHLVQLRAIHATVMRMTVCAPCLQRAQAGRLLGRGPRPCRRGRIPCLRGLRRQRG